jgi:hypothetical protein
MPSESFPVRAQLNATFARCNRLIVARRPGVWAKVTIKTKTDRKSAAAGQPKREAAAYSERSEITIGFRKNCCCAEIAPVWL